MMKSYQLYVFSQDHCPPCQRLKDHVHTVPTSWQNELAFVPLRGPSGDYTDLAKALGVTLTPTLVVTYEGVHCDLDEDGEEDCTYTEEPVDRAVGANEIIKQLPTLMSTYTYVDPPD